MNKFFLTAAIAFAGLTACNSNETSSKTEIDSTRITPTVNTDLKNASHVNELVTHYLHIKDALVADDDEDAAKGGEALASAIEKFDLSTLSEEQRKVYDDVKEDMKEHAEHINHNVGKIGHQREHFEILSKDVYDLVKVSGPSQTLYKTHCPMYNKNKGAYWLSTGKEIKNPYMDKKMEDCGEVQEEIQ